MKVFISYRRSDSQDVVGRLYDHLERRLGTQAIFKDTESISIGANFAERILANLREANFMLVVMGPTWLSAQDKAYRRRIDDPKDWVRQEIELALDAGTTIVPILVGDAHMPEREHLPPSVAALVSLQAIHLRPDPDFSRDVEQLCRGLGIPAEYAEYQVDGVKRVVRSPTVQRPLLIFSMRNDEAELELQYTLLFGTPAAAAPTARKVVSKRDLVSILDIGSTRKFPFSALSPYGDDLADLLLPSGFLDLLRFEEDTYLLIFHDSAAAQVPWEYVKIGHSFPAIAGGLSRRFISPLLRIPPLLLEHFAKPPRVLIIADPTGDLPGAREEGHRVAEAVRRSSPDVQLTMLVGSSATHASVMNELGQQSYDVLHHAGHVLFNERDPESSGLVMANHELLSPMHITEAAPMSPGLVLVSGSGAARISSYSTANKLGLAEAFLRCGVRDFIAPTGNIGDRDVLIFIMRFYSSLFRGATIGTSLREARLELWRAAQSDALTWVHFGLPENALVVDRDNVLG